MGILFLGGGGFLVGALLGQSFKYFVLIPVCGIAGLLVLASSALSDNSLLYGVLQAAVVNVNLQIGYVIGLLGRCFLGKTKRLEKLRTRAVEGTSSSPARTPGGGRRAA